MPAYPQFSGIHAILSGRMTYNAHGIAPSVASITFPPQAVTQSIGRLAFIDPENGTSVWFDNCLLDSVSASGGGTQPTVLRGRILDERVWWQNRYIRGAYNLRLPNGEVDPVTRKTPQELATLLLRAMRVPAFDVAGLPNDGEPEAIWDYAAAASELQKLCDSMGCRVVRELTGKVSIRRLGIGKVLPSYPNLQLDFTINPANLASDLMLVCAPTEWQAEYELEAVAEEHPGGKYVELDKVSYTPADGWEAEDPELLSIPEVDEPPDDKTTDYDLATASVFRAYRIIDSSNKFPQGLTLKDILPISGTVLDEETDDRTGRKVRKAAFVRGVHFDDSVTLDNTGENQRVQVPFSVRGDLGVIVFQGPVYRIGENGETLPAELRLTCSHSAIHPTERVPIRATYTVPIPNSSPNTGTRLIEHNELNLQVKPGSDNREILDSQAEYYLKSELAGMTSDQAGSIVTPGIVSVEPDGAIQQISWSCGSSGPTTTTISRNTEIDPYTPSYEVRTRALEQRKEAQQAAMERRRERRERSGRS